MRQRPCKDNSLPLSPNSKDSNRFTVHLQMRQIPRCIFTALELRELRLLRLNPCDFQSDSPKILGTDDVEGLPIGVAKRTNRKPYPLNHRHRNSAQMFALR